MEPLSSEDIQSVGSEDSYSGSLKPNSHTVAVAYDMLRTSFHLSAITLAFPKVEPVGSRVNNAWYILNVTTQQFVDLLCPICQNKPRPWERETNQENKYQRQEKKQNKSGGTLGRAFTEGETTSARYLDDSKVSGIGKENLKSTVQDTVGESENYLKFIKAKYWKAVQPDVRHFEVAFAAGDSWEDQIVMIGQKAGDIKKDAKARLRVYYSYFDAYYSEPAAKAHYKVDLQQALIPLSCRLEEVMELLRDLREISRELNIVGFRDIGRVYSDNINTILNLPSFVNGNRRNTE